MMKIICLVLFLFSVNSHGGLSIKTTLPELKWLTQELVGDKGSVQSLLSGHEDPHFVDVTPAFIFKIKEIDILVKNGLDLEMTWLPKIIELSGNSNLNGNGLCDASVNLDSKGKLVKVDRSMGDVHPHGNPHYTYSPIQMINAAKAIRNCLQKVDKSNFSFYGKQFVAIKNKLEALSQSVAKAISKLPRLNILTYHEEFLYFCQDYNLNCVDTLEDTPGVLPSATRLVKKVKFSKEKAIDFVLATDTNPIRILKKFKELSGISFIQIEAHMNTKVKSYDKFVGQLVKALETYGKK